MLLLVGVVGSTVVYRHFQGTDTEALVMQNRVVVNLSDADKKLIDVRDSTSKWLLGLAVALLPGLVVSKKTDGETKVQTKLLPLLAGAMLITSLYGFFLAQDSLAFVLSRGPQYHLYGWVSNFPILLQFWSVLAALVVLMIHWLRTDGKVTFLTLVLLAATLHPSTDAEANVVNPQAAKPCVNAWMVDRQVLLNAEQAARAASVLAGIAKRSDVSPASTCDFVSAQLDQVRWAAFRESRSSTTAAVDAVLKEMESDLRNTGMSPGELLEKLLAFGTIWRSPSGLIRLEGAPTGAIVLIDYRAVGLTNLDLRIKPGSYLVEVLVDGAVIFRKPGVTVEDGKQWKATFSK